VELLRAVNAHFEERGYPAKRYHRLVHRGLMPALVAQPRHPDDPSIPPLPSWAWAPLVERSRERVEGLHGLDVRVVGDPDLLLLPDEPPTGVVDDATEAAGPTHVPLEIVERALGGLIDGAFYDRLIAKQRGSRAAADDPAAGPTRRKPPRPGATT
jgi:hypothetical protein